MDQSKTIEKYLNPVRNAVAKTPRVVSIEVTTRCQLNCIYCTRDKNQPQDLGLERLAEIKNQFPELDRVIICGIGESFCYPEIYQIPEIFRNTKLSIITNGAIPIDFSKLTAAGNMNLLVFSIDATTPDKMATICRGYDFEALLKNLVNLWKYPRVARIINATLNQYNVDDIVNLVGFAARYRMHAVNFELPIGYYSFVEENRQFIQQQIKAAVKAAAEYGIIFNQFYRLSCISEGSMIPNIRLNGAVYPCCYGMYLGKSCGNIYQQDIREIWNEDLRCLLNNTLCRQCEQLKNLLAVSKEQVSHKPVSMVEGPAGEAG